MSPQRIQLSRAKGWRKPEGAVVVARPTIFGNPFRVIKSQCCDNWDVEDDNGMRYLVDHSRAHSAPGVTVGKEEATAQAVRLFADDLTYWFGGRITHDPDLAAAVGGLRGRDLACWCPPESPCHADVLLEIANAPVVTG